MIINVPSQRNILFTLDELMVVIRDEINKNNPAVYSVCQSFCRAEENYTANHLLKRQAIVGARERIN